MSRVSDLVGGDVVSLGGRSATFIGRSRHPDSPLELVVWRLDDGTVSLDALSVTQEVGEVVSPADDWRQRLEASLSVQERDWLPLLRAVDNVIHERREVLSRLRTSLNRLERVRKRYQPPTPPPESVLVMLGFDPAVRVAEFREDGTVVVVDVGSDPAIDTPSGPLTILSGSIIINFSDSGDENIASPN